VAAVVRGKSGPFVIEDIQLDEPRVDEVIVRVVSAGICHTDLIPREQAIPAPFPAVYGHEGADVADPGHPVDHGSAGEIVTRDPWGTTVRLRAPAHHDRSS
jgi:Zn-dependent alcohol dehydrogenase